jgi:putative endonuclease
MAGLVPAIHVLHLSPMSGGYVYILASAPNGILYVGVTNDLVRRIYEHRNGLIPGFTKKYSVKRLLCFEHYEEIQAAIQRANTTSSIGREMESEIDISDQSGLERSVRFDHLRTWMAGTSPAMTANTAQAK